MKIRVKIRCEQANKCRVFITNGGQVFRTQNHDINAWMKAGRYPKITTDSIRKAIEMAAASHSIDALKMGANRLNQPLQIADKNWVLSIRSALRSLVNAFPSISDEDRRVV